MGYMYQFTNADGINCANNLRLHEKKRSVLDTLYKEQRKLEAMVVEHFEKGRYNMGTDARILEQSTILDQLVVDEMMLDKMLKDYSEEQKAL